ncbi:MAG: cytochrome C biogenesis protein, partial [Verrucomicrobiota bacterium]
AIMMVAGGFRAPKQTGYVRDLDLKSFGQLPVVAEGRIKPIDSYARNALLIIRGKQKCYDADENKVSAVQWLMDTAMRPKVADAYKVFRIDHDEILGKMGKRQEKEKFFSFVEVEPVIDEVMEEAGKYSQLEAQLRSPYQRAVVRLASSLNLYQRIRFSLPVDSSAAGLTEEYDDFEKVMVPGREALAKFEAKEPYDETALQRFLGYAQHYRNLAQAPTTLIVPPVEPGEDTTGDWLTTGKSLENSLRSGSVDPVLRGYAKVIDAYKAAGDKPAAFNDAVLGLGVELKKRLTDKTKTRMAYERFFNQWEPFYRSSLVYVIVFLVAAFSWLVWPERLGRLAFWLMAFALAIHVFGLISRMYLQGRPPVTNLYSSAVFIGLISVMLCLLLEKITKLGVASAVGAAIGFSTLVIAHHLSKSGDTLEMMRAVLDTNFWLATHVVTVTIGYAATFLAGFLAIVYILRGFLTPGLN